MRLIIIIISFTIRKLEKKEGKEKQKPTDSSLSDVFSKESHLECRKKNKRSD